MCMMQPEHTSRRQGYIGMICVDDQHKRRRIGSHLAELAFAEFKRRECDLIVLETEDDNFRALTFYEALGFYKSRHHYRYYLNGKGAYQMVKWLREGGEMDLSDE